MHFSPLDQQHVPSRLQWPFMLSQIYIFLKKSVHNKVRSCSGSCTELICPCACRMSRLFCRRDTDCTVGPPRLGTFPVLSCAAISSAASLQTGTPRPGMLSGARILARWLQTSCSRGDVERDLGLMFPCAE